MPAIANQTERRLGMTGKGQDRYIRRAQPKWVGSAKLWRDFEKNVGNINDPTVTAASTRYGRTKGGVYVPFAANTPARTDDGLQVGPSRTNGVRNSKNFGGTNWAQNLTPTLTQNAGVNIDGTITASRLQAQNSNGFYGANVSHTSGTPKTVAFWVLNNGGVGLVQLAVGGGFFMSGGDRKVTFNPVTGALTNVNVAFTRTLVVLEPGGYWRVEMTFTPTVTGSGGAVVIYADSATPIDIFVGNVQCEDGLFAGPPIFTPSGGTAMTAADQAVWDLTGKLDLSQGVGGVVKIDLRGLSSSSCSVFDVNDGSVNNRFTIYSFSGNYRHALGKAGVYDANEPIVAAATTGLATFGFAVGPGYRQVRMVGQADPGADLSTDYPTSMGRVSLLGTGYSAANNSYGTVDKFALFDGPMDASRWDNQIWPKALEMADAA